MVEISLNNLVKLNRLASIGKLIGGLIHNLSGPLQNLGMDLEMMNLSLARQGTDETGSGEKIGIRLKRMSDEFDNIILQIKATSTKVNVTEEQGPYTDLNHFLQQELSFLKADLYFKHHVETLLEFEDNAPLLTHLQKDVPVSLRWFLQCLAEEMEKGGIKKLVLKSSSSPPYHQINLTTEDKCLPPEFCALLELDGSPPSKVLETEGEDLGIRLALYCLREQGGQLACITEDSRSSITLKLPLSDGDALDRKI